MKTQQQPPDKRPTGIWNLHGERLKGLATVIWNVQTMLKPGKMKEVEDHILKYEYNIMGLHEIRCHGQGQIQLSTPYYIADQKEELENMAQVS